MKLRNEDVNMIKVANMLGCKTPFPQYPQNKYDKELLKKVTDGEKIEAGFLEIYRREMDKVESIYEDRLSYYLEDIRDFVAKELSINSSSLVGKSLNCAMAELEEE